MLGIGTVLKNMVLAISGAVNELAIPKKRQKLGDFGHIKAP